MRLFAPPSHMLSRLEARPCRCMGALDKQLDPKQDMSSQYAVRSSDKPLLCKPSKFEMVSSEALGFRGFGYSKALLCNRAALASCRGRD